MLTESKGLRANKLGSLLLLYLAHTKFTCISVLFGVHLDIILRKAALAILLVESTVASIQDVSFWVGELGVAFCIDCAILVSDVLGH